MKKLTAIVVSAFCAAVVFTASAEDCWTGEPDYCVEYIQSTGEQYIDTGVNAATPLEADMVMMWDAIPSDGGFLAARLADGARLYLLYSFSQNWVLGYDTSFSTQGNVSKPTTNKKYHVHSRLANGSQTMLIDDKTAYDLKNSGTYDLQKNLYLFCMNKGGTANFHVSAKCYALKIWQGDELKRDFVPCVKNGEACLYDRESGEYFRNKTATPLVAGPAVYFGLDPIPPQKLNGAGVCEPHPTVWDYFDETKTPLIEDRDYTLSWANNDRIGQGTVTVTGIGAYAGKVSDYKFDIVSAYGDGSVYFASPDGADDAECTKQDPGSIKAAIDKALAASDNAVVLADGDYDCSKITNPTKEKYTFYVNKKMTIVSASETRDAAKLIGGGAESARGCFFLDQSVTLKGLMITNFTVAAEGAGIYFNQTGKLTISDCSIIDCHSTAGEYGSGAIYCNYSSASSASVSNSRFIKSSSSGSYGACCFRTGATIEDCDFIECKVESSYNVSGGTFNRCAFKNCEAKTCGSVGRADFNDCVIATCKGAVFGSYGQVANVNRCLITECADVGYADTFIQCVFSNNVGRLTTNTSTFRNCLIINNSLASGSLVSQGSVLENCTFVGNSGDSLLAGSGTTKPGMHPLNCVFAENTSSLLGATYNAWVTLDHCIFTEGAEKSASHSQWVAVTNCVFLKKPADCGKSEFEQMRFAGENDKGLPYYSLQRKSPAVDKGTNLTYTVESVDLAGNPRVVTKGESLAENPNAIVDIGCYENQERAPGLVLLVW